MTKKILSCLLFLFTFSVFCQDKFSDQFGNFDQSQLSQTIFPIDSSAEAITIYEKMTSEFIFNNYTNGGWMISSTIHVRKKILKKSAFDQGIINIQYYFGNAGAQEVIRNIKGATFNESGKTELAKSSIFNEKLEDKYYQTKLTFPNVKEGSIIEYQYTIDTPLSVSDKPKTWYFQGRNPALWSEIEVTIPSYFYYKIVQTGYLPLDINEQKTVDVHHGFPVPVTNSYSNIKTDGTRHRFVVKNAPAFEDEPFITTPKDYISKIGFELSQVSIPGDYTRNYSLTWADIDKTLLESDSWGRKIKKNNYLDDLVEELKKVADKKERLQKAYDYMTKTFKWNEETGLWMRSDLKKVFENKTGSASELNGIMVSLLRELKLDANPFILSTRSNGMINFSFPQIDNFNYTIAHAVIDSDTLFIDVTDPFLKLGSLPQRCINDIGRLIKPNEGELIEIKPKEKYIEYETFNLKFDKDLSKIIGHYSGAANGYLGHDMREVYKTVGAETFKKKTSEGYDDLKISNLKIENAEDLDNAFTSSFDFTKESDEANPDKIYFDPMMFGKVEKNPFHKTKRDFPVNFGHATSQIILGNFEIPEGYEVEELPKNVAVVLPDNGGKFSFLSTKSDKTIQYQSKLVLNKWIYDSLEYFDLSELYNRIVQKHAEQIVLKKK
jgi:hypothetical protein